MGSLGVSVRCMACESAIFERRRRSDRRTVKYGTVDIVDGVPYRLNVLVIGM